MPQKELYYFTSEYPYGTHETFVEAELNELSQYYDAIHLMPLKAHPSNTECRALPDNVHVVKPQMPKINTLQLLKTLFQKCFLLFQLIAFEFSSKEVGVVKKIRVFKSILTHALYCIIVAEALQPILKPKAVCYTFWMNESAIALAILKKQHKIRDLFVRAHGFDVFNERHSRGFIPFRTFVYKHVSMLFHVSKANKTYVNKHYPKYKAKQTVCYLGTKSHEFAINTAPKELVVFSCSNVIKLKRLALLIKILAKLNIPLNGTTRARGLC